MSDTALTIRPGEPHDAATIAAFMIHLARETEQIRLDPSTVAAGVDAVLADAAKGRYFVAMVGGQVVGCLMITHEWSDWRNGDMWWIQSVYVHGEFRKRGVFAALYAHVRTQATTAGAVALRLYVDRHNERAKKAYARLGMKATEYDLMAEELTGDA